MNQPDKSARRELFELMNDIPSKVAIKGTKREVEIRGMKPYTIERLTRVWLAREERKIDTPEDSLKSLCREPYFSIQEACLIVLNGYWRIKLFYPIMWRIWAYIRQYTESQMTPIIVEGKKKLPLMAHWTNMESSLDMRMDWMKMTKKEAEQYRAELLSVAKQPLLKNSPSTESADGE